MQYKFFEMNYSDCFLLATGFVETKRGCCGTGLVEAGPACNLLTPTCDEPAEYLFWDSIHPSQAACEYLAKYLEKEVLPKFYTNNSEAYFM